MWPFRPRYTLTVHEADEPLAGWFVRATAANHKILFHTECYSRPEDAMRAAEQIVRAKFTLAPGVKAAKHLSQDVP